MTTDIETTEQVREAWLSFRDPLMPLVMLGMFITSTTYLMVQTAYFMNGMMPPARMV